MSSREANLLGAALCATALLAGPRRTRPLAAFAYGLVLSRGQGASRERLEREVARLFDERQSAHRRLDELTDRLETLEAVNDAGFDRDPALELDVDQRIEQVTRRIPPATPPTRAGAGPKPPRPARGPARR